MNWMDDFQCGRKLSSLAGVLCLLLLATALILANLLVGKCPRRWSIGATLQPSQPVLDLSLKCSGPLRIDLVGMRILPPRDRRLLDLELYLKNYRALMSARGLPVDLGQADRPDLLGQIGILFSCGQSQCFISLDSTIGGQPSMEVDGLLPSPDALFLRALKKLLHIGEPTLYFLHGHGECTPDDHHSDQGLSRLRHLLTTYGIRSVPIAIDDLPTTDWTNALLLIVDPTTDLEDRESAELVDFLRQRSGRLLLILTDRSRNFFRDFLANFGMAVGPTLTGSEMALHWDWPADGPVPLPSLQRLHRAGLPIHCSGAVGLEFGGDDGEDRPSVWPLLMVPDPSDGTTTAIALASGRRISGQLPIHLAEGRLLVFGGNFLANRHLHSPANHRLLEALLDWFFEEEIIPTGSAAPVQYGLEKSDRRRLTIILLVGPAGLASLALVLNLYRRNR